jgi:hypothetical protein
MDGHKQHSSHYPHLKPSSKSYSTMSPQPEQPLETEASLDFALTVHPVHHEGPATDEEQLNNETPTDPEQQLPLYRRAWKRWCALYAINSFLILVVCAILIAYAYPPLGAVYLAPQITATWLAVMFIFSELFDACISLSTLSIIT